VQVHLEAVVVVGSAVEIEADSVVVEVEIEVGSVVVEVVVIEADSVEAEVCSSLTCLLLTKLLSCGG